MAKKIRVRITEKVATYTTEGKKYHPGDEVEIDFASFVADFMVKIEKPKKEPTPPPLEEPTPEPVATEEPVASIQQPEPKPVKKKKS